MITFTFVLLALAALTCLACTVLLFRGYARSGMGLLLWSALCFVFLTLNNLLLFFDLAVFADSIDLRPWRLAAALLGLVFLLYGFIFESD
jgi:drug/metabolite transporter (DMT)-like permease